MVVILKELHLKDSLVFSFTSVNNSLYSPVLLFTDHFYQNTAHYVAAFLLNILLNFSSDIPPLKFNEIDSDTDEI